MRTIKGWFKIFMVFGLSIFILSMSISAFAGVRKEPRYSQQNGKDFNTDAPWRVQNADTPIPFVFAIKDVHINDLEKLYKCEISITNPDETNATLIYSHDFNGITIDKNNNNVINGNWEYNITKFENPVNPYASLNGKDITASNLGFNKEGDTIYFKTEIAGEDELGTEVNFCKYLRVVVGTPLPKPSSDWYYGDTHYHTEYTDNPYEYGGTLISTKNAVEAMGLDWVTTTDHASNLWDIAYTDYDFDHWDLSEGAFANLKDRAKNLNGIDGLPFLVGEEVTVKARGEEDDDQLHLLVYNNSNFISGEINANMNPLYSLQSRLELLLSGDAFAFAAHPTYPEDTFGSGQFISDMVEWSYENYTTAIQHSRFRGLEVWNGRDAYKTTEITDNNVNPFNSNGEWEERNSEWDKKLQNGIGKWKTHLFYQLYDSLELSKPIRKIFIEGGSDAHGDFNYFTFGAFSNITEANDNALGKVRTLVYAPEGYQDTNILNGLKNGHSVITDGPVCIFGIDKNGDGELTNADTIIGNDVVLPKGSKLKFLIKWKSTKEFGSIYKFIICRGSAESAATTETTLNMTIMTGMTGDGYSGSFTWEEDMKTISNGMPYYYMMEVRSSTSSEEYRCLTNPIWVRWNNTTPDPTTAFQPVPDTGQTKCYDNYNEIPCPKEGEPFYGQDANYSRNPISFVKLDDNGVVLSDAATAWTMVRDNVTGLIWEMKTNDGTIHDVDNRYTWYDSNPDTNGGFAGYDGDGTDTEDFIKALNDANFGGYSDWRLPTVKELASIADYSCHQYNCCDQGAGEGVNQNYFPNTATSFYWTSTPDYEPNQNAKAWCVDFYYDSGSITWSCTKSKLNYVRAVRGGSNVDTYTMVDNGNSTVTDLTTGLVWQQATAGQMNWQAALDYCEILQLGGYTDWRLPTIKELRTIVDYRLYDPVIDTNMFTDTISELYWSSRLYWSSTTKIPNAYESSYRKAWGVYFWTGSDSSPDKKEIHYVRAVRGGQAGSLDNLVISVAPSSSSVSNSAGTTTFTVSNTGTGTMAWSASVTSGSSWLSIISGSSGSNSGTITCNYTANTTTSSRTATIRVTANQAAGSPKDVTVTQAAGSSTTCEVLTPQSPKITVYNGESVKVFGSGGNTITVKLGGNIECVNFVGANVVNIEDSASGFTVRRSGAMVYLENLSTGTFIKIPATKTSQTLTFAGGVSYTLIINNGKVMLGDKEVTLTARQL